MTPPDPATDIANDPSRARRLERLAQRREVPRPPTLDPAQGRGLRARAAAEDKAGKFGERLAQVQRDQQRREARARRWRVAEVVASIAVAVLVGMVVGASRSAPAGLAVAVGVLVVTDAARRIARRAAASRGASAWDWQRGTYVLFGKPAERVQQADRADPPKDRWGV